MSATLSALIDLALRALHVAAAIAWVGSSFYFMWLERQLNIPPRNPENGHVAGDLWALHSGAFYHSQKYASVPGPLPTPLHRFRWQAYTTWLSGAALMCLVYYANADLYLVEPQRRALSAVAAIAASVGLIVAAWYVYHRLCQWLHNDLHLVLVGIALLTAASAGACALFTGRGAFMQIGAMLGTVMVANVYFVIMGAQREILAAIAHGQAPDPALGARARRRSIHNNYLALPVLVCMLSQHYPLLYGQPHNWLVLISLMLAGALARHGVNLHHAGRRPWLPLLGAGVLTASIGASIARPAPIPGSGLDQSNDVSAIVDHRCRPCHSAAPTFPGTLTAPAGVVFDTNEHLYRWATRIHERAVVSRTMPQNNVTGMTEEERHRIDQWFLSEAASDRRPRPSDPM